MKIQICTVTGMNGTHAECRRMEAEFAGLSKGWRKKTRNPHKMKTHFIVMLLLLRLHRQKQNPSATSVKSNTHNNEV